MTALIWLGNVCQAATTMANSGGKPLASGATVPDFVPRNFENVGFVGVFGAGSIPVPQVRLRHRSAGICKTLQNRTFLHILIFRLPTGAGEFRVSPCRREGKLIESRPILQNVDTWPEDGRQKKAYVTCLFPLNHPPRQPMFASTITSPPPYPTTADSDGIPWEYRLPWS